MKRSKNGQFAKVPFSQSNFLPLKVMVAMTLAGFCIEWLYTPPQEPITPFVAVVTAKAYEPAVETIVEPSVEDKIRAAFPEDPETAVRIAKCESSLRSHAIHKNKNGSVDTGIFQINSVHKYSQKDLFDVDFNIRVARKLYDRQGWAPWVCYRSMK